MERRISSGDKTSSHVAPITMTGSQFGLISRNGEVLGIETDEQASSHREVLGSRQRLVGHVNLKSLEKKRRYVSPQD